MKGSLPEGSCDCHFHVFGPGSSLDPGRSYTPENAGLETYQETFSPLGLSRGVIVQPSVYGTDNRTTLDAVAEAGEAFRAIVVVEEDVALSELRAFHDQGARGARVNMLFSSGAQGADVAALARKLAEVGWHLQVLTDVSTLPDLEGFVRSLPVPVVFDHFGHLPAAGGEKAPAFQTLLKLVAEGLAWVKLSGSYRVTAERDAPYSDVAPLAQALVRANPERLLWGSDWPHPQIAIPRPAPEALVEMLFDWVPDAETRRRVLVENPATLYGFGDVT